MTNIMITQEARKILERSGYMVIPGPATDMFHFEDSSLVGFLKAADTAQEILSNWEGLQDDFLRSLDRRLRNAGEKSWNIYSVILSAGFPGAGQIADLKSIEEDFRASRKIVRGGITSASDVAKVLLPLVPIQNPVTLVEEDVISRLRNRMTSIPSEAFTAIVGNRSDADVAALLSGRHEDNAN
jgi:hypothetical protein